MPSESSSFGPFSLDIARRSLTREGTEIALQPRVFDTLAYLVRHAGRTVPKAELLARIWQRRVVGDGALARCIKELRRALDDDARSPEYIRNVARVGYVFIAPVSSLEPQAPLPSVAVLPFGPLLRSSRDEVLEFGVAEAIIHALSVLPSLVVRPLSAVRKYAGCEDPLAAGREQQVDYVVEGTLQRTGAALRISVRILRAADATALLAEHFDERFGELPAVQDSICLRIASALALKLTQTETRLLARPLARDASAWHLYLLGRLRTAKHTPDDDRRAIECYQRALEADPRLAAAWAGLADTYESLATHEPGGGHFERSRACAERALEIDPDNAAAHTCLGKIAWERSFDWSAAETHLRHAIEISPGNAEAHLALSDFLAYQLRFSESVEHATHALRIDPTSPWVNALLAQALHLAGRYDDAISQARRTLDHTPDFAFAHLFLGLSLLMSDELEAGVMQLEKARSLSGRPDFVGALGFAYARSGRTREARALLTQLAGTGTPCIAPALINMGLGENDRALDLLERAASQRDWHVLLLNAEPVFAPLRRTRRARQLLASIGVRGVGAR